RGRSDAADLVVVGPVIARVAGAVGGAAPVVVDVSSLGAVVDGSEGTGPAVEDVVGPAGAMAAGASVPPPPAQAEPARTRTAPRATLRKRMATNASGWPGGPSVRVSDCLQWTRRIRWLPVSAMRTSPVGVTSTPRGPATWAAAGAPPSPEKPLVPVPAKVVMVPDGLTRRMRWFCSSAM